MLEAALGPFARSWQDFLGIGTDRRRQGDLDRGESGETFPIEPGRGCAVAGQPIEHQVIKDRIAAQRVIGRTLIVGPGPHLLKDPARQRHRAIDQSIAHRLRPGALLLGIARIPVLIMLQRRQGFLLGRRRVLKVGRLRPSDRHVEVDPQTALRFDYPDRGGHGRAPVPALRHPAGIPQPLHQFGPGHGDFWHTPPGLSRLARKPKAGQRRRYDMERQLARGRIGQGFDHAHEFDHRSRPAMRDHQRHRIGARRTQVQKVNVEPLDLGLELAERIQLCLAPPPVVPVAPIAGQVLQHLQRRALRPIAHAFLFGPASKIEPQVKVIKLGLGNGECEGPNLCHCGRLSDLAIRRNRSNMRSSRFCPARTSAILLL